MADILITHAENFSPEARKVLEQQHRVFPCHGPLPTGAGEGFADVIWVRLERIEPSDLRFMPRLKVLATNCTDVSHLPLEECARRNIRVVSLQDCREEMPSVHSTAEHTVGLMLALLRQIPAAVESVKKNVWSEGLELVPDWDRWQFVGRELRGKRVAIIGAGRVGKQVNDILHAWGCPITWYDPPKFGDASIQPSLEWADIVTVHTSLNDSSRGMFNAERFAQMKPGAYFVNTARGAIVDEGALLAVLESGHLAGAALDVVCDEPNVNPALVEFARREPSRLLISPHIAGATVEGLWATELMIARKLVEVLR